MNGRIVAVASVAMVAIVALAAACDEGEEDGGEEPSASVEVEGTDTPVAPEPTQRPQAPEKPTTTSQGPSTADLSSREGALRQSVAAAAQGFIGGDYAKFYGYFSSGFQEDCPLEGFVALFALVNRALGDISAAEFKIDAVRIEGDDGYVNAHLELDGQQPGGANGEDERYADYWILEGGDWKSITEVPTFLWNLPNVELVYTGVEFRGRQPPNIIGYYEVDGQRMDLQGVPQGCIG